MMAGLLLCAAVGMANATPALDMLVIASRLEATPPAPLVGVAWSAPSHRRSVQALIEGREAELESDWSTAIEAYRRATVADPANSAAWAGLVRVGTAVGANAVAGQALLMQLQIDPERVTLLDAAADMALRAGQDDLARTLLVRLALSEPALPDERQVRWMSALASHLERSGETDAASAFRAEAGVLGESLARRRPIGSEDRRRWEWLIRRLAAEGGQSLARSLLERRLSAGNLPLAADRGRCVSACLALDAATADTAATVALITHLPRSQRRLRLDFRRDVPLAELWVQAAIVHQTAGNRSGARLLLERALEEDSAHRLGLNNLGYILLEDGLLDEADPMITAVWESDPDQPALIDSVGWLRLKQGRVESDSEGRGALDLLREAARRSDHLDPIILLHLGDAESAAGHADAARRTWRHALALLEHPDFKSTNVRTFDRIQMNDWGVRVIDSEDLYDLEFGAVAPALRSRLNTEPMDRSGTP